jgi:NTE family protein
MASAASGQESSPRLRIGVCLAGGGARGGAHIGVLQVLEEMRVPVDCIAGTSIGSIVGGLYASGMSPAAMDSAVSSIDWFSVFDDEPARRLTDFRRKQEDYLPYFDLRMGIGKDGLSRPGGIVSGQKLMFLLRQLTLHTTGIDNFDDLSIPYRAVAASLEDGTMVVLGDGTLADAMRASMAIPGVFSPHVIDGETLVDGGILRNVPYDIAKSMGADIVIVVDVTMPPDQLEADPSLPGVLKQILKLTIVINSMDSLSEMAADDLLLVPDLAGIGVQNFDRIADTTGRGVAVARENLDWLRQYSLPEAEYEAWRSRIRAGTVTDELMIGDITVPAPSRVDVRRITGRIHSQPGSPLDMELLADDLENIYRLGEFEMVDFALKPGADLNTRDLAIRTHDKRWGPNYLRFGAALEGHLDGRANVALLLYHRMAAINSLGAEWRNQIILGDRLGLDTEFYQPLTMNGLLFVAPRLNGLVSKRDRWLSTDFATRVTSREWEGRLDLGLNLSSWGEFRLGAFTGDYSGDLENLPGALDNSRGGWRSSLILDKLDDVDFPRRGWGFGLEGRLAREGLGSDLEYDRLLGRLQGVATAGRVSFNGRLEGGTSFGAELPFDDRFELGGFSRLSGLERGRVFGDDMALATATVYVRFARLDDSLGQHVYLGLAFETGQAWAFDEEPALGDLLVGGTAFLGVETLLGPFYAGYGLVEGGQESFYFMLGRTF